MTLRAASRAQLAHQALRQHAAQARGQQIGFQPHVHEPGDRAGSIIRVQRREDEVPRQRRAHGDVGCFSVARFADEHDVGVLPQNVA